jgi:hypothetical protein
VDPHGYFEASIKFADFVWRGNDSAYFETYFGNRDSNTKKFRLGDRSRSEGAIQHKTCTGKHQTSSTVAEVVS